jgi:sulfur carrier protein
MIFTINGDKEDIGPVDTLEGLLRIVGVTTDTKGVAVALNGEVVPRSAWASARVQENDSVEIVYAVQGG